MSRLCLRGEALIRYPLSVLHQHRSADDGIRAEVVMTQRQWQYNGVAPMREILDWCHQYLDQSSWHYPGWETLVFRDDCAWMMFALRWQ